VHVSLLAPSSRLIVAFAALALSGALGALALPSCAHTASEEERNNARIHHDIAINALNNNDLRGALGELLAAVEQDPELPQAHNALGLVFHAMGRLDDSLEHYHKAIALKPTFSDAYNNMGVLLIDLGRYDDAIAAFKVATGDILYPTPSLPEGNMGWAYFKKGDNEAAQRHLRNAVATNPKFCRGYEWLARIALEQDRAAEVVVNCRRFEKYCGADPLIVKTLAPDYLRQMQYYLAMALLKQGESDAARATLSACASDDAANEFGGKCLASLRALR